MDGTASRLPGWCVLVRSRWMKEGGSGVLMARRCAVASCNRRSGVCVCVYVGTAVPAARVRWSSASRGAGRRARACASILARAPLRAAGRVVLPPIFFCFFSPNRRGGQTYWKKRFPFPHSLALRTNVGGGRRGKRRGCQAAVPLSGPRSAPPARCLAGSSLFSFEACRCLRAPRDARPCAPPPLSPLRLLSFRARAHVCVCVRAVVATRWRQVDVL